MIRFRMVRINVDQFALLVDKAPDEGLSYTVNLGFKGAANANRLSCEFAVEFAHNNRPIIKLGIMCEFDIHPEDWDKCIKDNVLTISKNDLGFLGSQTVGVARGVMHCKTEGTNFWNFILPPIDLTKIINEDLVIDLTK